jgi:uroporphyrinogen-III synthase
MRVLVTRPIDEAVATAAQLAARGHQTVIAPLLEIRFLEGPPIALDGVQAILATSSNGVRAFSKRSVRRDLPFFAVGAQTASAAISLGFSNVKSANGDAHALAQAVPGWATPQDGALLHASGSENPGPLASNLIALGYEVRTAVLYCAVPVLQLPKAANSALRAGMLDAVLMFSPRTANAFVACTTGDGLQEYCRPLVAYCISEAAAVPLASLNFLGIRWPAHPDQPSLLALLD